MQRSRNYKGINYYRYRVTIPQRIITELGLERGTVLDVSVLGDKMIIKKFDNR